NPETVRARLRLRSESLRGLDQPSASTPRRAVPFSGRDPRQFLRGAIRALLSKPSPRRRQPVANARAFPDACVPDRPDVCDATLRDVDSRAAPVRRSFVDADPANGLKLSPPVSIPGSTA